MRAHLYLATLLLIPTVAIAATPADDKPPSASNPPEGTPPAKPTPEGAKHQPRGWNDKRRTTRSYPGNLGYNALRVFTTERNFPPLLIGAGLTGIATAFDTRTVQYFNDHPQEKFGNLGADVGGTAAVAGLTIGLFSAGRIAPGDRFRSFTYDASQSMLIATAYTFAIKGSTRRLRPDGSNRQSFPSGHAALAFSWASVLGRYYGVAAGIPAYSVASLIAVSRLAHHSHYLSDIVAGSTIGYTVGRTVVRGNTRPAAGPPAGPVVPDLPKAKVELMPDFGPQGDGAGARVMVSF